MQSPKFKFSFICILLALAGCLGQGCSNRFSHSVQQVSSAPTAATTTTNYSDSTITLPAGAHYRRSRLHVFFYGLHYRPAWATPVEVPVLDLGTAKGGLTPIQKGGSRQTINLRLEDKEGKEYVLRSIDKDPAGALPTKWQNSYIANIARDATSATHPYAALTLPDMAEAVGIYYATPELVYVPHDPRLGEYKDSIGGMVAILERRPAGDQSDNPRMGNAKKVKSTRSMLESRLSDNTVKVDARFFLRSRLFDMLIGDWSRHEDNWRWAEFEEDDKTNFKAVPRDRDNVFYRLNDAVIPWIFMRAGFKPHFQTFRSNLKNVADLNRSGRNLDEIILAELEYKDWIEVADSVQNALSDDVIERAFRNMPDTIYQLTAETLIRRLKSRRDMLPSITKNYYHELAKTVYIVGTDKQELFEIDVLSKNQVQIRIYKTNKNGEKKHLILNRICDSKTTDEIHLYGLDSHDRFSIKGSVNPKFKIKIWGGAGEDTYTLMANDSRLGKSIFIEDSQYRNTFKVDKHTKVKINDNPEATKFTAAGWLLRYYLD